MSRIYRDDHSVRDFYPALIANGMIGIRPERDPVKAGVCTVPGFITKAQWGTETQTMAPYPFTGKILFGNRDITETSSPVSQELNMDTGELVSVCDYDAGNGETVRIRSVLTALRKIPTLLFIKLDICCPDTDSVSVELFPEFTGNSGVCEIRKTLDDADCYTTYLCETPLTGLGITVAQKRTAGEVLAVACMIPGFYNPMPDVESRRIASFAVMQGLDTLLGKNEDEWSRLWESAPVIDGPGWAQKASDEAYFYLISSTHRCSGLGVACYAQSNPYNLQGQVFWDMDFYTMPALMLLQPDSAKAMARYRIACLDSAKKLADIFGYDGAMYPWQSGLYGTEETVSSCACGWAEHHINGDVAVSLWEFANVLGDDDFTENEVWPVLREIADWIASRGEFTEKGYEISNIMGVDEGSNNNRNNLYCNTVFKMAVRAAIDCADRIGRKAPEIWKRVWEEMYFARAEDGRLLVNEGQDLVNDGVNISYSPGMLQYLWVHGPELYGATDTDDFRKFYAFEEDIRLKLKDDPSNPASKNCPGFIIPPMAVSAAFNGEKEKAGKLIRQSHDSYASEPYAVTTEYPMLPQYRGFNTGEYITNHGSFIEHVILGFTGMRHVKDGLACYPASLPEGWNRIILPKVFYRGKTYRVEAEDGKPAVLIPADPGN